MIVPVGVSFKTDDSDEGDATASAASVLHVNPGEMNSDREYGAVISGLDASGYLGKANQTGIIVEGCPGNTATYENTLVPLMAKLGLKKPIMAQLECTSGFGSAGADATAIANDILTFGSDGVDRSHTSPDTCSAAPPRRVPSGAACP